jgi:hypothetical protein
LLLVGLLFGCGEKTCEELCEDKADECDDIEEDACREGCDLIDEVKECRDELDELVECENDTGDICHECRGTATTVDCESECAPEAEALLYCAWAYCMSNANAPECD